MRTILAASLAILAAITVFMTTYSQRAVVPDIAAESTNVTTYIRDRIDRLYHIDNELEPFRNAFEQLKANHTKPAFHTDGRIFRHILTSIADLPYYRLDETLAPRLEHMLSTVMVRRGYHCLKLYQNRVVKNDALRNPAHIWQLEKCSMEVGRITRDLTLMWFVAAEAPSIEKQMADWASFEAMHQREERRSLNVWKQCIGDLRLSKAEQNLLGVQAFLVDNEALLASMPKLSGGMLEELRDLQVLLSQQCRNVREVHYGWPAGSKEKVLDAMFDIQESKDL